MGPSGSDPATARRFNEQLEIDERLPEDDRYSYAAAWGFRGVGNPPELNKEPLTFDYVHPSQRSYK